jgi:hypothetical protein
LDVVLSREIPWFVRKASNFGFLNWNSPPIGPIKLKRWGALSFILQDPFAVSYATEWEFDMQASSSIYCKIHRRRVVLNSNTHESKSRIIVKFYSYLVVDFAIFTDKETCQGRGNLVNEKLFVCTDYRVVRIYFYVQKPALISDFISLLYCTRDRWKYTNRTQLKRIKIQGVLFFMNIFSMRMLQIQRAVKRGWAFYYESQIVVTVVSRSYIYANWLYKLENTYELYVVYMYKLLV